MTNHFKRAKVGKQDVEVKIELGGYWEEHFIKYIDSLDILS